MIQARTDRIPSSFGRTLLPLAHRGSAGSTRTAPCARKQPRGMQFTDVSGLLLMAQRRRTSRINDVNHIRHVDHKPDTIVSCAIRRGRCTVGVYPFAAVVCAPSRVGPHSPHRRGIEPAPFAHTSAGM